MVRNTNDENEVIDYRGIHLPIGIAKAQGPIEDFIITIFDRNGTTYRFRANGGNICMCENDLADKTIEYEVR